MNRYSNTKTYKEENGVLYLGVTKYPEIPATDQDIYVYVTDGDRLDNLANAFYGDPTLYWILQVANNDCKKDSLYPPIGIQLRIPQNITKILDDFETLNG